jgi:KaiC/GvpD/RAD55 family RecA-like ATPase
LAKISIGVRGIDNLLSGGVIAGNTVLVEGIPGAGKTTLGMEFIYRGIRDFGDPGIILTFEQFPESLYRDARSLGCTFCPIFYPSFRSATTTVIWLVLLRFTSARPLARGR